MSDENPKNEYDAMIDSFILGWADRVGIRSMVSSAYERGRWRGSEDGEERGKIIQRNIHREQQRKAKGKKP